MSTQPPPPLRSPHRGAIAWMAKNPVAANLLMVALLIGGALSGTMVQQEVFPEFELDYVSIQVPFPGATPTEAEDVVTSIEQNVSGLDGVKRVTATAAEGLAVVSVELLSGVDQQVVLADVKNAVDRITTLPANAERPIVSLLQNRREVISLIFYGDVGEEVLKGLAEDAKARLEMAPGITLVETAGIRSAEIGIEIQEARLREYGLTIEEVAGRIRASALEIPAGGIKTAGGEILVRTRTKPKVGSEFGAIPVATARDGSQVRLGDIANVSDAFADVDQMTLFDGKPAAMVKVFRIGSETPVSVATAAKDWVAKRQAELPEGVGLALWNDQSELFKDRMTLLTSNGIISFFLVLFVLGLFLEMRLAFWVTLGIPISVLGSFVVLGGTDVSINMVSMFAFIVTLGIVVDDAIIVSENIWAKREAGLPPLRAAIEGAREVAVPVTFSVLTTVAAFVPMFFVPGVSGKIFVAIPAVVVSVLAMSLIESFFILPAHLGHGGKKRPLWKHMRLWAIVFGVLFFVAGGASGAPPFLGLITGIFVGAAVPVIFTGVTAVMTFLRHRVSRGFDWVTQRLYAPFIRAALGARYLTAAISLGVMAVALIQCPSGRLRFSQFPRIESDLVSVTATLPFGAAMADSEVVAEALVGAAKAAFDTHGGAESHGRGIYAQIGGSLPSFGPVAAQGSAGSHTVLVQVLLVPSDKRPFGALDFTKTWREKAGLLPGLDTISFRGAIGMSGSAIDVMFIGDEMEAIEAAATDFAAELGKFQGVKDIDPGFQRGKPQVEFGLTRLGEAAGLTVAEIGRQVRNAYFGAEVLRQQRGTDELKVMIRLPEDVRQTEYSLENLMLRTPDGREIRFADAAELDRGYAYTAIRRQDGRRSISVKADVELTVTTGDEVYRTLLGPEGTLARILARHPGITYDLSGERRDQNESNQSLMVNGIFALFAIFALIAMAFKSWLKPVAVLLVVPMAAGWAFVAHLLLGYDLSIISMMGIVALAGVAVNDSIVLIDAAAGFMRNERMTAFEAAVAAGVRRFRPIWLTSLTTFLGLAPMIFETSVQARFLIPMAISLGFGVLFATISTLVSIPALYLILEDLRYLFGFGPSIHVVRTLEEEGWEDEEPESSGGPGSAATGPAPEYARGA
jgi:multidrug efflux pump subunit AcrB